MLGQTTWRINRGPVNIIDKLQNALTRHMIFLRHYARSRYTTAGGDADEVHPGNPCGIERFDHAT
jgi:hypothetical protein